MALERLNILLNTPLENECDHEHFKNWFLEQFQIPESLNDNSNRTECTLEEFAVFFLNIIKQHTAIHLLNNGFDIPSCEKKYSLKIQEGAGGPINTASGNLTRESLLHQNQHENDVLNSSNQENEEHEFSSALKNNTSTPVQRIKKINRRIVTTVSNEKQARSSSNSLCFGDFLNHSTPNKSSKRKTNQKASENVNQMKPKLIKRVVPTTISRNCEAISAVHSAAGAFSSNSAFSNDNNILKLSESEIIDKNKCTVLEARMSLKENALKISKEIGSISNISTLSRNNTIEIDCQSSISIDIKYVTHCNIIDRLAIMFTTIIELNLTTNILKELSYILNLLNTVETCKQDCSSDINIENLLKSATNCVYFSINVLQKQRHLLALLDVRSLGIILENDRIAEFAPGLKQFLDHIYMQKKKLELKANESQFLTNIPFKNVHFQQESNSRTNFTSYNEFVAFKSQRDLFYRILKIWETNHLNPSWRFSTQITPKIQMIFKHSEHPNTMAHLANLFVSQLLISSKHGAPSTTEIGVEMNSEKFNKLSQRLIAPSNFSVELEFPGTQTFFREFITESRSIVFAEQIKLALFGELMLLNNSTFDILSVQRVKTEETNNGCAKEYVLRPEVISSMLVLAKFLGLVSAQPFTYEGVNSSIDKQQFVLRKQLFPNFDIHRIVVNAYEENKLLITIPWLVQYLTMLDNVTLQLDNYSSAIHFLFDIYANLDLKFNPTYSFIMKCCLGWLFENTTLTELYYTRRQTIKVKKLNYLESVKKEDNDNLSFINIKRSQFKEIPDIFLTFNPMLESILNVSCPFLSEFRVSIMPIKNSITKYVSRSGRYRHITTRIAELSNPLISFPSKSHENIQNKLIEAFMHSQSCSVRRVVEFIIERTYSAVVKDAQIKFLIPSKCLADRKVNAIESKNLKEVLDMVNNIYVQCRKEAVHQWDDSVTQMIDIRIKKALDALLPEETSPILQRTYYSLIRKKCETKVDNWRYTNLRNSYFYCSDVMETSKRIVKLNDKPRQVDKSNLIIKKRLPSVSVLLEELQYWLHCTTMRLDLISTNTGEQIEKLLIRLRLSIIANTLPITLFRIVGTCTLQLLKNIIEKFPAYITLSLLAVAKDIWLLDGMECMIDIPVNCEINRNTFRGLVTIPFIRSLAERKESFEKLELFLVVLVNDGFVTIEYLNELFVPILKERWSPNVLNKISKTLEAVARKTTQTDEKGGP